MEFEARKRAPDGATKRDHDESAARQWAALGKRKAQLMEPDRPECPQEFAYLWNWFEELSLGLPLNGFTVPLVDWAVLDAWRSLTGTAVEPWEARTLVHLGALRASIMSEKK